MDESVVAAQWRMPDQMWERIEPLLPRLRTSRKGGRPWIENRKIADGIFYVLRTGCQMEGRTARLRLGQHAAPAVPAADAHLRAVERLARACV